MKKILFLGLVMLQCLTTQAQDWKFSVGAGANFNGPAGETLVDGNRFGYHLGGTAQYEFSQQSSWYLSGSLFWTQKGYKVKTDILDDSKPEPKSFRGKVSTDITYLQIPIFVGKNFDLGERTKLFVELGPYASLALFGKDKFAGQSTSKIFEQHGYKRLDAGLAIGAGIQIADHYRIRLGYEHGLTNLRKGGEPSYYNRNITLSVGYTF